MSEEYVGFVGLGRMGRPMCARLVGASHRVLAYDAGGTAERLPAGATPATSISEMAHETDVILISVPDGTASREVCSQIADASVRVRIVVELSTIGVEVARSCHDVVTATGIDYVDAPVSGGVSGAERGALSLMVSGPSRAIETLRPILGTLGERLFWLGPEPGQGQAMKLINNFVNATALTATSEAVLLGTRFGLSLEQMIEVLNASTGRTSASIDKFPRSVIPGTYDFGFATELMAKDLTLYREEARSASVPGQMGEAVGRLWEAFAQSCPGTDFTYFYEYLRTLDADA
jgi:3-hydroxyisobutyrate dehydrogenase